ncbi:aspartate--tRNA(Asn) ligase [Candidatus Woesearchaeota archaeon]|nr:aspartate--tRNA(Asn) ligase [Candidatus Woesearchaeota archaeon]
MERTYIKDIKGKKEVFLQGWIHDLRELAKAKFLLLRDKSGVIQCVLKQESKGFQEKLSLESVVSIQGKIKPAKLTSAELTIHDYEIEVTSLEVLNKAETLPMQVFEKDKNIQTDLSTRLDYRSLDLRKSKVKAIFTIQSEIATSFREFFKQNGFLEIQCPSIIASASEGGTELFQVKYFEKQAYLAQSPQLYKQLCAISLEKVFTITPVCRAEKHNTIRHLNESRQMDIEAAFSDDMQVMKYLEEVIQFIIKNVIKNCSQELSLLNLKIKVPKIKYLSYEEAIKLCKIKYGEDFSPEDEKRLCEMFPDTIIFTHSWPLSLKPFYILPKDKKLSKGFDALYMGIEISSGGQRVHIPEILIKQLKERNLNPKNFEFYVDSFRHGGAPHSGWSIGLERFTMALLKLDNIREACIWPRDRDRIAP